MFEVAKEYGLPRRFPVVVFGIAALLLSTNPMSLNAQSPVADMSVFEQMELAFINHPDPEEIQPVVDRALRLYGLEITRENRSRLGSTLVAMQNEFNVPEMKILRRAIRMHDPSINIRLPKAVALAAVAIVSER